MSSQPFDLPTLRNHYNYFTVNNKKLPILYRLKSGVYYPYIAFDLVINELNAHCLKWTSITKLPLLSMTYNEQILYKNLCPNEEFSSSKLILCSIIDQYLELFEYLKQIKSSKKLENQTKFYIRFKIDIECGSIREIDVLNSELTTQYNHIRSTYFPSIQHVKRRLCFDEENYNLPSIGGYLQLDRCIYPYIIVSSDILLNLNDLKKPFCSSLNMLMPYFHSQTENLINNYMKIVEYGTRYIKKYKYYYKNIDDRFISLDHLLLLHRSIMFVQIFNSNKISLKYLHEYYRSDFSNLLSTHISNCGYLNNQPCINEWSLYDSSVNNNFRTRLTTKNETLLINWLLIYNNKCTEVHHQKNDLILVQQQLSFVREKLKTIQNEHARKQTLFLKSKITV